MDEAKVADFAKLRTASLRIWYLAPREDPYLAVDREGQDGKTVWLSELRPGDVLDYIQPPPGSYKFTVKDMKTNAPVAEAIKVDLRPKSWTTMVVTPDPNGKFPCKITVIDDTYNYSLSAPATLHFTNASAASVVAQAKGTSRISVPPGATVDLPNVPPATKEASVAVTVKDKPPRLFTIPVDFDNGRSAAIVITENRYGNPIPRFLLSGYVYSPPMEEAPSQ